MVEYCITKLLSKCTQTEEEPIRSSLKLLTQKNVSDRIVTRHDYNVASAQSSSNHGTIFCTEAVPHKVVVAQFLPLLSEPQVVAHYWQPCWA